VVARISSAEALTRLAASSSTFADLADDAGSQRAEPRATIDAVRSEAMRGRQARNHQRPRNGQYDPAAVAAEFKCERPRLIVDEETAGADMGRPPILINADTSRANQIKHEMIAGILPDFPRSAHNLHPTI
jgi:hypothetical protein